MLHPLRILPVVALIACLTFITDIPARAGSDSVSGEDFREVRQHRHESLVRQLTQFGEKSVTTSIVPDTETEQSIIPPVAAKASRLEGMLDTLRIRQRATSASPYLHTGRNIFMPPGDAMMGKTDYAWAPEHGHTVTPLAEINVLSEDMADDPGTIPAPPSEVVPAAPDEEIDYTPLPPAPRVQATPEVKDANVSLVSQMRALRRAVAAGEDDTPAAAATVTAAGAAPSQEPDDDAAALLESYEPPIPVPPVAPAPPAPPAPPRQQAERFAGDPAEHLFDWEFVELPLTTVVSLIADSTGANIVAGTELRGTVTLSLQQVNFRDAIDAALRVNGLGIVQERNIYYIVPYMEAATANRERRIIPIKNTDINEVEKLVKAVVKDLVDEAAITVTSNPETNLLVISAPKYRIQELVDLVREVDSEEAAYQTEIIEVRHANPDAIKKVVEEMLAKDRKASVVADTWARYLIVKATPADIGRITEFVGRIDIAAKQVVIDTMVVDAILSDEADTGVQWLIDSVRRMSRRQAALGEDGRAIGNLQELALISDLEAITNPGGLLSFSVLTDRIDWHGLIQMEIRNRNGHLVSNPVLLTVENEEATISISQEIPYIELIQTQAGGQQTTTSFKEIGTVLSVRPQVSTNNTILCTIEAKESTVSGTFQNIPIEDKREIQSTMRMANGQTIFIGGLRKSDSSSTVKKIPILGDVPIVNFMFRSNQRKEQINELLVFLTCTVIDDRDDQGKDVFPKLTPFQQEVFDSAPPPLVPRVDAFQSLLDDARYPHDSKTSKLNRTGSL